MWTNIKEWLSSKKTKTMIAAQVAAVSGYFAGALTGKQAVGACILAALALILGQGIADLGTGGSAALKAKNGD